MLKLKLQYFGHLMQRTDSFEKTLMLGKIEGGRRDHRGWDGWMASLTQWTLVWVNARNWWWTERPGVLQSMGSHRVGHDWVTELNWTDIPHTVTSLILLPCMCSRGYDQSHWDASCLGRAFQHYFNPGYIQLWSSINYWLFFLTLSFTNALGQESRPRPRAVLVRGPDQAAKQEMSGRWAHVLTAAPHCPLSPSPWKETSSTNLVPRAKKIGDHCSREYFAL